MPPGRSARRLRRLTPTQGDQTEAVNTKPGSKPLTTTLRHSHTTQLIAGARRQASSARSPTGMSRAPPATQVPMQLHTATKQRASAKPLSRSPAGPLLGEDDPVSLAMRETEQRVTQRNVRTGCRSAAP